MKELKDKIDDHCKEDDYGFSLEQVIGDKEHLLTEVDNAIKYLKLARIYTQRIDWLVSGDDSPETFYKRLKEDLDEVEGD